MVSGRVMERMWCGMSPRAEGDSAGGAARTLHDLKSAPHVFAREVREKKAPHLHSSYEALGGELDYTVYTVYFLLCIYTPLLCIYTHQS